MNIKAVLILLVVMISISEVYTQSSAILDVESTTQGFLPPRMSTSQRDAIVSPLDGLMIYNTGTGEYNFYDSFLSEWIVLYSGELPNHITTTQTLILGPAEFRAARSSDNYQSNYGVGSAFINSPASSRLVAGIQLPIGSTINEITFYYLDNNTGAELSMDLDYEVMNFGSFVTIQEFNTGVATASGSYLSHTISSIGHIITDDRAYFIDVFSTGWAGSNMAIKGVKINYTLPNN